MNKDKADASKDKGEGNKDQGESNKDKGEENKGEGSKGEGNREKAETAPRPKRPDRKPLGSAYSVATISQRHVFFFSLFYCAG